MIERALELGVDYFDTAPAYAASMDYLGSVIPPHRDRIFLACKTADRTRDGSMRVLDDVLRRLRVNSLDWWQLHDIRTMREVDRIFGADGAIHALGEAHRQGIVKHLGLTGHQDPDVLLEAMRRFAFDTVLLPLNPADVHRLSFIESVLPAAVERGMGVIAMKVYGGGPLVRNGSAELLLRYVLSLPGVSTAIIGCRTPDEVTENARMAMGFEVMAATERQNLESAYGSGDWLPYKRGDLVHPGL